MLTLKSIFIMILVILFLSIVNNNIGVQIIGVITLFFISYAIFEVYKIRKNKQHNLKKITNKIKELEFRQSKQIRILDNKIYENIENECIDILNDYEIKFIQSNYELYSNIKIINSKNFDESIGLINDIICEKYNKFAKIDSVGFISFESFTYNYKDSLEFGGGSVNV